MTASTTTAVVQAEGLQKTYKGDVRALDGLSFRAAAGSIFALLGPNGPARRPPSGS